MLYHSISTGPDVQAVKDGFKKCHQLALASSKKMKICIHTKDQLKGSSIEDALGEKFVKALLKGPKPIQGVTILLETERKENDTPMVVFAPHISSEYLYKIIFKNAQSDVVYLPWMDEELQNYLKKHPDSIQI